MMDMGSGLSLFGGITSAFGDLVQGEAEGNALDTASDVQKNNARLALEAGQFNAQRQTIAANRKIGAEEAAYGASGVTATSGSVLNVLAASHANAELDRLNILHGADIRAINDQNQAEMDSIGASSARTGSYFNAVGSIFGGAAKAYGNQAGSSTYGGADTSGKFGDYTGDGGEGDGTGYSQASFHSSTTTNSPSWQFTDNSSAYS